MGDALTRKTGPRRAHGRAPWLACAFALACACGHPPEEADAEEAGTYTESVPANETAALRARYPSEWKVAVPDGTRLARLRDRLDKEIALLPERDLEDQSPLPIWFRVYLRKTFPDLEKSGPYQYPRTASRILQSFLADPDSELLGEL